MNTASSDGNIALFLITFLKVIFGRVDIAVFRSGAWYIKNSTNGITTAQFGISSDAAVPNIYIGQ